MNKFGAHTLVDGTSALQPEETAPASAAIIAFPGTGEGLQAGRTRGLHEKPSRRASAAQHIRSASQRSLERVQRSEMVYSLTHESMAGVAFDRMTRTQAVLVGAVFTAVAFAVLFIGA